MKQCIKCAYFRNDFCCYTYPYLFIPSKYKSRFQNCNCFYEEPKIETILPRDSKGRFVKRS